MEFRSNISYKIESGMKVSLSILILLIFCSCQKTKSTNYLQEDEVKLVAPRIQANSVLIDSFVTLTASLKVEGVDIRFTTDGSEPTDSSFNYISPVKIEEPGTYRFSAVHPNFIPSESTSISFFKKGQSPDKISWTTKPNDKYVGEGDNTVINDQKGTFSFGTNQWVGFDTIAKAMVSFKANTHINTISIGYLSDPQSWIFPPQSVTVIINGDEKNKQIIIIAVLKKNEAAKLEGLEIAINQKVTSISLEIENLAVIPEWHDGKDQKAWLFMDEWIFN